MESKYEQLLNHAIKIEDKIDRKYVDKRLAYILNRIEAKDEWMAQHEVNMLWHYFINVGIPLDMR